MRLSYLSFTIQNFAQKSLLWIFLFSCWLLWPSWTVACLAPLSIGFLNEIKVFLNKQTKNKLGDSIHKNLIKGIESQKLHSRHSLSGKILRQLEHHFFFLTFFFNMVKSNFFLAILPLSTQPFWSLFMRETRNLKLNFLRGEILLEGHFQVSFIGLPNRITLC